MRVGDIVQIRPECGFDFLRGLIFIALEVKETAVVIDYDMVDVRHDLHIPRRDCVVVGRAKWIEDSGGWAVLDARVTE